MTKLIGIFFSAAVVFFSTGCDRESNSSQSRVGVYDSRSVAVAFAGSGKFNQWISRLTEERDRARAEGDVNWLAELKMEGAGRQAVMHRQAFSTAPVDDILIHIRDQLPAIREKAGVSALVSKWDDEALKGYGQADRIDVTLALIDAFGPSEKQRRSAIEIQKRDPLPLDEAGRIRDPTKTATEK